MSRMHRLLTILVAITVALSIGVGSSYVALGARPSHETHVRGVFNNPGNMLISDQFNNRAVEIDPVSKRIVWSFGGSSPRTCNPGPHTIIGLNDAERLSDGLTLLAGTGIALGASPAAPDFSCADNRVIVVSEDRRIVWQYGQAGVAGSGPNQLNVPVFALQLPNRNIMIVDQSNERVIEVDRFTKNIVWQYGAPGVTGTADNQLNNPNSAELLSNGNVLIGDENNDRAIEVKPTPGVGGHIVKSFTAEGTVSGIAFASRLPNGNTLLTDSNHARIVEVDANDHPVWSYFTNTQAGSNPNPLPTNAVRLQNGNTVIADQYNHRAFIIDQSSNIKFQYGVLNEFGFGPNHLDGPYTAFILGDYTGQTPPPAHF